MTLIIFISLISFTGAGEFLPEHLTISQITAELPMIRVYAHVNDQEWNPISGLPKERFNLTVGPWPTEIEHALPFSQTFEGVGFIVLVDISKSLSPRHFELIKTALLQWNTRLHENDRMALIAFGTGVSLQHEFSSDPVLFNQALENLVANDRETHLYDALARALVLGQREDKAWPIRRAIVVLSDGKDEGSGFTREDVMEHLALKPVPIYTLGFSTFTGEERARHLSLLKNFSSRSRGLYFEVRDEDFPQVYQKVHERIQTAYSLLARCENCIGDGQDYAVQLGLKDGRRRLKDRAMVVLQASSAVNSETKALEEKSQPLTKRLKNLLWWFALAIVLIVAIVLLGFLFKHRQQLKSLPLPSVLDVKKPSPVEIALVSEATQVDEANASLPDEQVPEPSFPKVDAPLLAQLSPRVNKPELQIYISPLARGAATIGPTPLTPTLVLGRNSTLSDCLKYDDNVSGRHCEISTQAGRILIRDLNSRNGTWVNGIAIKNEHFLENGDVVTIGATRLRINWERVL